MKKIWCISAFIVFQGWTLTGQIWFSKSGTISFLSDAPLEKIEGTNSNALVVWDQTTGKMEWSVLIQGFRFEKALMEEHFNENYMESHKFPKGLFVGRVENMEDIAFDKNGQYPVKVTGDLTLHGVSKPFTGIGKLRVDAQQLQVSSTFDILLSDYNILVPKVVRENIAKTVRIEVEADLQQMK